MEEMSHYRRKANTANKQVIPFIRKTFILPYTFPKSEEPRHDKYDIGEQRIGASHSRNNPQRI